MKKTILTAVFTLSLIFAKAQVTIDTVSLGATYANQTWYSLQNNEQGSAPKNNWDLAFDASGFGTSIHINSITGTQLWKYPNAGISAWNSLDTAGLAAWPALYNSDTSWTFGAFDKGMIFSNQFDLGWGVYNQVTHVVSGDSLYVIKLASGAYKKLWIESLAGGAYTFQYADIDGANAQTATLTKANYTNKNFGYYSLQNNAALDREPISAEWDLLFTQYSTFIPTAYTVTGILHNTGVLTSKVEPIADAHSYTNWITESFDTEISTIGYDWKSFNGMGYDITDSLVYFVQSKSGDIWKIIPLGFGGSANGNFIFSKEKLSTTSIFDANDNTTNSLTVYPNPSSTGATTIVYSAKNKTSAVLNVMDITGKIIDSEILNNNMGLNTFQLNTSAFSSGIYFVSIDVDGKKLQQKLIIN